ncbi:hypothetical protein D9V34_06045 [Mycetocola lacteus]|uniref:Uncharacterized protein n=1 Tax=Mycetocola lacteus TaxID=76637 RepID=A0A3L7AR10_9MICO|nr:hypothetical protein [Mycetocola lacteus]RLP82817.1 hypothetical protein D9V34_06045 [Mycetocola lacteus]
MSTPENPTSPEQPADEQAETGVWERLERAAEAPQVVAPVADTFTPPHASQQATPLPGFAQDPQAAPLPGFAQGTAASAGHSAAGQSAAGHPAAGHPVGQPGDQSAAHSAAGPFSVGQFAGQPGAEQPARAAREPRPVRTVGVFTLREVLFVILSALLVLISFVPAFHLGQFGAPLTLWNLQFAPMPVAVSILPLIALALVLLRRLVPRVSWRVGSLSVDQFASVATVIAAVGYVLFVSAYTVLTVPGQINWSLPVGTILALATLFTSTFAPFLPVFKTEFGERDESPAAPAARAPRVITPTPRPRAAQPTPGAAGFGAPVGAPAQPVRTAPFWVYSYTPRPVHSVDGQSVLFEMGPGAWVLAVEDRGTALVLRTDDGRIGILHDLSNLTRG